ncbi:MAG: hypothetical protein WBZ27_15285, partial [Pseudolabrys sp.]
EKKYQLGGSHDHPIDLHLCGGSASCDDVDVARVPGSKQHEACWQPKLRSGRRKNQLQSVFGGKENR